MTSSIIHFEGAAVAQNRVSDTWERGSPYERYVGRWSRQIAPQFLAWLNLPAGLCWLDVGCGTGALTAAIVDGCAPSAVVGVEPSEGFLKVAEGNLGGRARFLPGNASTIPLKASSVDVVVSGLVLNFVPDPGVALAEMCRVTKANGEIAAYVWDYAGKMELMRYFWDAAVALNPEAGPMDEGLRFPSCNPTALMALFDRPCLVAPQIRAIDVPTPFSSFDEYWEPFLGGQGPAPAYAMSLVESERSALRERLRSTLPVRADGSLALVARAWAIRASVASPG